ncbi:MAG: diacylglycerol kinase family lipid kinase [Trueperaceae bacterium]|nr:diacylglycerol kinase family lipid kinase [Trueperaceae bacterium]MCC6312030.1 diacylglycerol kinase family lipid kinase [Trueperaceae bacterium]MCO5173810.1 diacylglycerol kinase family lipid kinase [Trueperaceae bacterium]MCW5820560.1 diacylglycerol kinase family lipid kinase [Trueperaceae bacterium]
MLQLVFNPAAGKGRAKAALAAALALLDERGVPYTLHTTRCAGHATELAAATPPGSVVVAIGGDGTVHEVAKGLLQAGTAGDPAGGRALGVLPLGSGDDFAFSLGLARDDLPGALERLLAAKPRLVDFGTVNGEPFFNAVGTGLDAEVAERVKTSPSFLRGLSGYLYSVLGALGHLREPHARVFVDGALVHDGPCLLVTSQNGPRSGGSFVFAPEARPDDGLLDVVIAGKLGMLGALGLLPKVMRAKHLDHPAVKLVRGSQVRAEWAEARPAHADGELLPAAATYEVVLHPRALRVLA